MFSWGIRNGIIIVKVQNFIKLIRYLRTIRKEINILTTIALVVLTVKLLYLNFVEEIVPWGSQVGDVIEKLCISIVSSYIFYLIVVHLKTEKDKENVIPYVTERVNRIVGDCSSQLSVLQRASDINLVLDDLTGEQVETAFQKIDPRSQAPLRFFETGTNANWIQFMDYHRTRTTQEIERLLRKITFLDSELVQVLAELEVCTHFSTLAFTVNLPFKNTDMTAWAISFFDYCILIKRLDKYAKTKLANYV